VSGLSKEGHKCLLFAPGSSEVDLPGVELVGFSDRGSKEDLLENEEYISKGYLSRKQVQQSQKLADKYSVEYSDFILQELKRRIQQGDSLDILNLRFYSKRLLGELPRLAGLPCVYSLHSPSRWLGSEFQGWTVTVHTNAMSGLLPKDANARIIRYGVRTDHIPFSAEVLSQAPQSEVKLEIQKQLDGRDYLLFLSSIGRHKGTKTAIELAGKEGIPIIVAGTPQPNDPSTYDRSIKYFEQEIKPLIDGQNVLYFGNANEEEKYELMKFAKALVFPSGFEDHSCKEAYGRVVAESLATGAPVVAYANSGGPAEQIIDGEVGYLFSTFLEAAEAIRNLHRIDRGKCRKHALRNLSAEIFVGETISLFESLLIN